MTTWTLVLVFLGKSLTSTTVTGFTSADSCAAAVIQLKADDTNRDISMASCVAVK